MRFAINEKITTELNWEEIALIAVVFGEYQERYEQSEGKEVLKTMSSLVNRLGRELYNHPDNDKPNGH